MHLNLPDDILLSIAAYLSDEDLQSLLSVHPTFCHLAMRQRYERLRITDVDPDGLGRIYLEARLERLRDPFVTGYVRHAHICMTWTQKRWKRNGGHVTHIPTEDEEDALVRTLSSLQAVESVKLEWQSKPDSSVPRLRDITSAIAAGTHTTSLTLLAPATDLNAFARAADPVMMRQLTHLEVEFVRGNRQVPTDLSALGQCIATAGDAQLASLHLIVRTTVSLKALLDKMSESTMRRLTVFKMAIPIIEIENGHGDYSHQLKLLLHHVAPRLEHFSLDMHSHPTSEAIIAWRERWQTPLLALQILNLSWPSLHSVGSIFHSWPRKAIHQDVFAQSTLPWISSTGTSLTELCLGNVVLQEESLHKLVHAVERTLLRLQRLRIGLHIIQPQTLDIISRSCMDLAELEIRYKYLLAPNGPTIEFMDDVDLWDCDHELWARAISAFAAGCAAYHDQWKLREATFMCVDRPSMYEDRQACDMFVEAVRRFAPSANIVLPGSRAYNLCQ